MGRDVTRELLQIYLLVDLTRKFTSTFAVIGYKVPSCVFYIHKKKIKNLRATACMHKIGSKKLQLDANPPALTHTFQQPSAIATPTFKPPSVLQNSQTTLTTSFYSMYAQEQARLLTSLAQMPFPFQERPIGHQDALESILAGSEWIPHDVCPSIFLFRNIN
jgi:hypothetical protein